MSPRQLLYSTALAVRRDDFDSVSRSSINPNCNSSLPTTKKVCGDVVMCPKDNREQQKLRGDPYSILNVDQSASVETIQRSYKTLSRSLHPDKQPPGDVQEAAQEVFVSFKNARRLLLCVLDRSTCVLIFFFHSGARDDVLIDPVLRQVYDNFGHDGLRIVRLSIHSSDADALYPTLARLHREGQPQMAKAYLVDALQGEEVGRMDQAVRVSATLDFPCTVESFHLQPGPFAIPELQRASMSLSATTTSSSKWSTTVGAVTNTENGKANAYGTLAVAYKPVQGTQIAADVDLTHPFKFSVGTTRTFSNRTVVVTSMRTIPNNDALGLSVVSHRALLDNQVRGTWAFGFGTDLAVHYGLLSFTTLWEDLPRFTAKMNLGTTYPFKLSAKHDFAKGRTGYFSYAFGGGLVEYRVLLSRALTAYATWSTGIHHATDSGLTWLLQLERGDMTFRIPINISSVMGSSYPYKVIYMSLLTLLMDEALGDFVNDVSSRVAGPTPTVNPEREAALLSLSKSRKDAEYQISLMKTAAETCRKEEASSNGLVIHAATYSVEGGLSVEVSVPLQFFVRSGRLELPATPKSDLMGFYCIVSTIDPDVPWWKRRFFGQGRHQQPVPRLCVRYSSAGELYEVTVLDHEALILPSARAFHLGASSILR